jgi:tetratricopeptide (TPR) repeat protein
MVMRSLVIALCCSAFLLTVPAFGRQQSSAQEDKEAASARAAEESSSKDTRIDLSPPADDQKNHPMSGAAVADAQESASDVEELHPWDPHKAAKDVEVGDYYFKLKNYKAAIERYKDALIYKPNDAIAQFRLAESLDKSGNSDEAVGHYQAYLKILPEGRYSADARKALLRLGGTQAKSSAAAK